MRLSLFALFGALVAAQQFVPPPTGLNVVKSKLFNGAEISYKKTSVCETTKGVNAYSGYVKLPKHLLPDFQHWDDERAAHVFFWYFGTTPSLSLLSLNGLLTSIAEARNNASTAPTSIYLGGGPGGSSFDMTNLFPCTINSDSNSTTLNPISWNRRVNMLYIDQPVGTGFSYVDLVNGTINTLTQEFTPIKNGKVPKTNTTFLQATVNAESPETLPKTTMSGARTLYAFAQVWFNEFPKWQTSNDRISLWTSSYGGFYGPHYFAYFQDQNTLVENGASSWENATVLNLATLGLLEPSIDARSLAKSYAQFGHHNTYGLQFFNDSVYEQMLKKTEEPKTGCYALIDKCREAVREGDPQRFGNNATVNKACMGATKLCFIELQGYLAELSDRNPFDVTHSSHTLFPLPYMEGFMNQPWVQHDLGVPLNFTTSGNGIANYWFGEIGDVMIGAHHTLERVIARGVNVATLYGDRDYRVPWYGGENISLSLDFRGADKFRSAGYASIKTNSSYDGGFVREYGNVSFSRIFQSGHGVAAYQPSTLSAVFERVMFRKDLATGKVDLKKNKGYSTKGPMSVAGVKNKLPARIENTCFVRDAPLSCTEEQMGALAVGKAVVKEGVVVEPKGEKPKEIKSSHKGRFM
ncbi:hypothetical protein F53441_11140 [Fusarium austroafricanum]|uniref:Serine carboxypeptidase n=1 Tax=Fusarium austroafricanum TaxID=2364996 RepID=A0A8H4K4B1_9HYPO|nr:hypothetical protein F53441_11140 [Fusarium austroafricanum]